MISRKSIIELTSIPLKYQTDTNDIISNTGLFEDERKEEKHTTKCYDGDNVLTEGVCGDINTFVDTYIVPVVINGKTVFRKVRFYENSIVEILENEYGFAKFGIYSSGGKARRIRLKSPVFQTINECKEEYDRLHKI